MDFITELETMAALAIDPSDHEPDYDNINRWQALFGYSYSEASQQIQHHRSNLFRMTISDSHWEMLRVDKEAQGYDRESYEHSCNLPQANMPKQPAPTKNMKPTIYLLKLEGPLSTPATVKSVANLTELPVKFNGTDNQGLAAFFCKVNETENTKILHHLSKAGLRFQPTFIRYSKAEKDLSATSLHPTLGVDATIPHNRPASTNDTRLLPTQNEYPVWYFFYGTLADPSVIHDLLGITPAYHPAKVEGGVLTTWGGKYKALVDAPQHTPATIHGKALIITTQEQEDALQCYETDKYEVVRCLIEMNDGEKVRGLTFRFISEPDGGDK